MQDLTWVEISREAVVNNLAVLRGRIGEGVKLCVCVKANAYGHGLVEFSRLAASAGAEMLAMNALYEARALREAGVDVPLFIMGYVALSDLAEAAELGASLVVYNLETVAALGKLGRPVKVQIKIETGNNRQGVRLEDLAEFGRAILACGNIEVEGATTHFANIEDTTDDSYARGQLANFERGLAILREVGINPPLVHAANSAATLLFDDALFTMVRCGIAAYGLWPSKETLLSFRGIGELKPVMSWKTRVAQVKKVAAGEFVGYGCTYRTTRATVLAILPVGYYDGFDRGAGAAYVLIRGKRAPVRGRICMNIIMVDITDIAGVELEDEVVIIGESGSDRVTAEQFASWAGTINYEVVTRVNERIARRINN
ncbi:alanine racemase [Candidatus Gracilibacteria bacterium]|nr:alanine racemase [Candidatus Gracilibacteria bacterium]